MRVLAIDTCAPVIGVGLLVEGEARVRTSRVTRGAEAHLMPWALELCAEAGITLAELDGVAAAVGPGAFTGLRVGLAAACGVALAAGIPVWEGSSLVSRGVAAADREPALVMLDARKGRVYAAVVRGSGEILDGPGDVAPAIALSWLQAPFRVTGEGSLVYADRVSEEGGSVVSNADDPAVDRLARLGAAGLQRGEGVAPESITPVYLRAPDAKPPKHRQPRRGR